MTGRRTPPRHYGFKSDSVTPETFLQALERAAYDPISNVIFYPRPYQKLYDGVALPYNMTARSFWANWEKIQNRLRVFHETAHFFQTRGTFHGFVLFELAMREIQEIKMLVEECEFKLPLRDHFAKLYPTTRKLRPSDKFLLMFFFYGWLKQFRRWQEGTCSLSPTQGDSGGDPTVVAVSEGPAIPWLKRNYERHVATLAYPCCASQSTVELGSIQLCEAYAQSIEFEHLLWFNKAEGHRVLHRFMRDPRSIDYTVAMFLFVQGLPRAYLNEMPFLYAHLRAIIDLSLMAHGPLMSGTGLTFEESGPSCVLDSTAHPVATFLGALEAMPSIRPAKDVKDDLLRFYNDLCHALRIPDVGTASKMARKTAEATVAQLNKGKISEPHAKVFVEMLSFREEDPLFFINDIIFNDRWNEVMKRFDRKVLVVAEEVYNEHHDTLVDSCMLLEATQEIAERFVHESNPCCPWGRRSGRPRCGKFFRGECSARFAGMSQKLRKACSLASMWGYCV